MRQVAEKISLIGSEGSGKTCFLAGLRWLSSPTEATPFTMTGRNQQSQEYLEFLHSALESGHCPPPTHKIDNLDLTAGYKKRWFNIKVQDAPGEDFKRAALSGDDKHPIIVNILESQYILICLDVDRDVRNRAPHLDRIEAIFAVLHRNQDVCKSKKIAILLTKADASGIPQEEWTDSSASSFLKKYNSSLVQKLDDCSLDFNVFFVASLGSPMTNNEPPKPYGYDQIFAWLSNKRSQMAVESFLTGHRRAVWAVAILVLGLVGVWIFMYFSEKHNIEIARDPTALEKIKVVAISKISDEGTKRAIIDERLSNFKEELQHASSVDRYHELYGRIADNCAKITMSVTQEKMFKELQQEISERLEDEYIRHLEDFAHTKNRDEFDKMLGLYYGDKFSSRNKSEHVADLAKQIEDGLMAGKKRTIGAIVVDCNLSHRDDLLHKMKEVEDFASSASISESEKKEMRQAVADMKKIMSNIKYKITFVQSGKLSHRGWNSYLRIKIGARENEGEHKIPPEEYSVGVEPAWGCVETIKWEVGDPIEVRWRCNKWYWLRRNEVASCKISGDCFALLNLLSCPCMLTATKEGYFQDGPYLKVECEDFPDAKESKRLIEKYLVPGGYWKE